MDITKRLLYVIWKVFYICLIVFLFCLALLCVIIIAMFYWILFGKANLFLYIVSLLKRLKVFYKKLKQINKWTTTLFST
jgi:hypothetical protein